MFASDWKPVMSHSEYTCVRLSFTDSLSRAPWIHPETS